MTKKRLIAGLIIFLLILGGLIVWGLNRSSSEKLLQENPNLPENEWPRIVTIKEAGPGYKIISNKFDGYEIAVPSGWNASQVALKDGGHEIKTEDLTLRIFVLDRIEQAKAFLPASARFETTEVAAGTAYRTSFQPTEDNIDSRGNVLEVPVENSIVISYIFPLDERIYLVSCLTTGDKFKELSSLCEKQILTFKIIK